MDAIFSPSLKEVLLVKETDNFSVEMDLAAFAAKVAERFPDNRYAAGLLLAGVSGVQKVHDIIDSIARFLPFDSVVRDAATMGHLAKWLSRRAIFEMVHDWKVVGLPHSLFDNLSWKERNEVVR